MHCASGIQVLVSDCGLCPGTADGEPYLRALRRLRLLYALRQQYCRQQVAPTMAQYRRYCCCCTTRRRVPWPWPQPAARVVHDLGKREESNRGSGPSIAYAMMLGLNLYYWSEDFYIRHTFGPNCKFGSEQCQMGANWHILYRDRMTRH
eukprot:1376700-Rhodomonas_salina.1